MGKQALIDQRDFLLRYIPKLKAGQIGAWSSEAGYYNAAITDLAPAERKLADIEEHLALSAKMGWRS
jgi:hypothetical protein